MTTRRVHDGFLKVDIVETPQERWEVVRTSDSVSVLFFDVVRQRILLVRQQRAPMRTDKNPDGFIEEPVAGRFDVTLGPKALAVKEALEEAGVTITEDDVELLNDGVPMAVSAGVLTERAYLAYVEVRPAQIEAEERTFGVAAEHEATTRVWVPIAELERHVCEDVRVFTLIQWFLRNKLRKEH